jgi:SAM-dependent methyltransferase
MENKPETKPVVQSYWDFIALKSKDSDREELWRAHMKEVYRKLKERWRKDGRVERALKTDLYDEAVSRHDLISLIGSECDHMVGTDISFETVQAAKRRLIDTWGGWNQVAVSDARNQAFKSHTFDEILSNSTLDHFPSRTDLMASLAELHRILKPGGSLIITLDNPRNPVVWLRNRLPYRFLKRFGVIPYYMGVTLSVSGLTDALEYAGFKVCDGTVIVHSPRIFAIWTGYLLSKTEREGIKTCFRRLLGAFELLENLPTKHWSGYFVAVKAVKPAGQ